MNSNTGNNKSKTILIVDDERVVLQVTRDMLARLGYRVLIAESGKQAIELAETFDGVIDMVIVDMVLPDMNGEKVYRRIADARPDSKIMISSGYAREDVARKTNINGDNFIQKPYSFHALSTKVKEILESKEAPTPEQANNHHA